MSTLESQNLESPEGEAIEPVEPAFGWTLYAEQVNGRFAMLGFVMLVILEAVTHQDLFTWLGLR
ncbi:high light inducible protein [Oscillatoriales cyanobacterium LEGE 11467]|uniref:High light inducible protein n=1 Tax=Zarconia navalis LEGE 11467 TaxID=1828826 RepID=A0A928VZ40_9CYAN|nr:high light inducible protein [Zarconia navalis LEGE 11467]